MPGGAVSHELERTGAKPDLLLKYVLSETKEQTDNKSKEDIPKNLWGQTLIYLSQQKSKLTMSDPGRFPIDEGKTADSHIVAEKIDA